MKTWKNVAGCFAVEVLVDDNGVVIDENTEQPIPPLAGLIAGDESYTLEINFLSSGHHDPSSMYGGPDGVGYPPEDDDERIAVSAVLTDGGLELRLDDAARDELADLFQDEIYAVELEDE